MSEAIPFQFEIGRVTGLPTASHAARFALTHNLLLSGVQDSELCTSKAISQRSVPLIRSLITLAEVSSQAVIAENWEDATGAVLAVYMDTVAAVHAEPFKEAHPVVGWLKSLDSDPRPVEKRWKPSITKVFKYNSKSEEPRFRAAAQERVGKMVHEAVVEGLMTTAAFLDVIPRVAARECRDAPDQAYKRCVELVHGSAPFIVEASGFGKVMNDVFLRTLSARPESFSGCGQEKYWRLLLDATHFESKSVEGARAHRDLVSITDSSREAVMSAYNALPPNEGRDAEQLFGCPAHAAAGITKIYRTMANIGIRSGLFEQAVADALAG